MEPKLEEKNSFNNNNEIPENANNLIENSNKKTPEKRHRRGKDVLEGRQYSCDYCKKAYLSKPALNSHLNTKHKEELKKNNIQKKKRGRPRNLLLLMETIMNMKKLNLFPFLLMKILEKKYQMKMKIIIKFLLILIIFVIMFMMKLKNF